MFGHLQGWFEKKAIHIFIGDYWRRFFPKLPSYQTFVARLNQLEQTFQTIAGYLSQQLGQARSPEIDHLIDSLQVMLAKVGHAYTATVAREVANVGFCASKKTYFHGVRLYTITQRRNGTLPLPNQIWMREGSCHDLRSVKADPNFETMLKEQQTTLYAPRKKPKGNESDDTQKYYNHLVSRLRQPIESFFNWLIDKTDIQRASTVRSTDDLLDHCFGKLTVAFLLLVSNS